MMCPGCQKLAVLHTVRQCVRCKGTILENLSCICGQCSKDQGVCSVCLKRLSLSSDPTKNHALKSGCRSCGGGSR